MNSESRRKVDMVKYVHGNDLDKLAARVNVMLDEGLSLYGDAFRLGDGMVQTMVKYKVTEEFNRRVMVHFSDFDEGKEKRLIVEAPNENSAKALIENSYNCEIISAYTV